MAEFMTVKEFAVRLGIPRSRIYRMIQQRQLQPKLNPGTTRPYLFDEDDVRNYKDRMEVVNGY